jgi:acyl dehydratase
VENTITGHRPVRVGETVSVTSRSTSPRDHAKGTVVDFVTEARVGGELVWESTSTYLRRGRGADDAEPGLQLTDMPEGGIEWRLPGDLGRRYAAVSGDHNPIHLYPLTAKALGFPRQIAHGMWSLARCAAALENRLPDAVTVDAAFKKPILLPGTVAFGTSATGDGHAFSLTSPKDGSPHLLGRAVPA